MAFLRAEILCSFWGRFWHCFLVQQLQELAQGVPHLKHTQYFVRQPVVQLHLG